jgi:hypothetical protein
LFSLIANVVDVVAREKLGHMSQWRQRTTWKSYGRVCLQTPPLYLLKHPGRLFIHTGLQPGEKASPKTGNRLNGFPQPPLSSHRAKARCE